jgi:bla regulator protein blaR1
MNTVSIFINSLGSAIINSLWQGSVIFLILFTVLHTFKNLSSKLRYHLCYLSLVAMLFWFVTNIFRAFQELQGIAIRVTEGSNATSSKTFIITNYPKDYSFQSIAGVQTTNAMEWIALAYIIGVTFFAFRFIISLARIQVIKKKGIANPPAHLLEMIKNLSFKLGIKQKVSLLLSSRVDIPVVFGVLKPIILMPVSAMNQLSPDQLEAILIHELAHLKRNDFLFNIFQVMMETILFFNPFTWIISRLIKREREYCCDDAVVEHTTAPLPYAQALATLEAYRSETNLAMAANPGSQNLFTRVKRIMEMKNERFRYSPATLIILLALIVASVSLLTPSIAQSKKEKVEVKEKAKRSDNEEKAMPVSRKKIKIVTSQGLKKTEENDDETSVNPGFAADYEIDGDDTIYKVSGEVLTAMQKEELKASIDRSLSAVNWEDINKSVETAMAAVGWEKMNNSIQHAMQGMEKAMNDPKMKAKMKKELKAAMKEMKKDMEEAKKEMARARVEVWQHQRKMSGKKIPFPPAPPPPPSAHNIPPPPAVPGVPQGSGSSSFSYHTDDYESMLKQMDKEGLIDRNNGYEIEKKGNRLYINGREQPDHVLDCYRRYLKGDEITVKGKKGNLNINISNTN